MIPGLSGPLLSHDALSHSTGPWSARGPEGSSISIVHNRLGQWHATLRTHLGPSCSSRRVFDLVADPLARALGYEVIPFGGSDDGIDALLRAGGVPAAVLIVSAWDTSNAAVWRRAVHRGLAHRTRWCLCINGPALRIVDAERTYARRYAEFDLETAFENESTFAVLYGLLSASSVEARGGPAVLDRVVAMCEKHRDRVRLSLRQGVHEALLRLIEAFRLVASRRHADHLLLHESLTVVYRILFLLFAEARGLVPGWHPTYRDGYTIETLRRQIERPSGVTGVWETLQAMARLAHQGCRAGTLRVPPFNGRLFSPADAPLADSLPLDDLVVSRALTALTTRRTRESVETISYADLGVEQLGGVYEHLLDYDLATAPRGAPAVLVPTGRRKATGSFYTPRSLTDFVVRRTLAPVVRDRSPGEILEIRVLDPAMGSGAFLVGACRYLAASYEQALVREGTLSEGDVTEDDRAAFRRAVAQRCLFGVDVNPMAVQLARLSLWLATLAAEKPLTFLDHHLRTGNSLLGASVEDIVRQPAPGGASGRSGHLPLFGYDEFQDSLESAVSARIALARTPDDTLEQVRGKETLLRSLNGPGGALARWKAAADLWCAAWFRKRAARADAAAYRDLLDRVTRSGGVLPARVAEPLLDEVRRIADENRFFHWTFEFPEIFADRADDGMGSPGFDVILGNPPWEVVHEDGAGTSARKLHAFIRGSGLFPLQGRGHANLYQLFFERAVRLLRHGGRVGLILPAGFSTDHAGAGLRRFLFDRTRVETFALLDNRDGIFPIHRSLRFLLLTFCAGGSTAEVAVRPGIRSAGALDTVPDEGGDEHALRIRRALIEQVAGDSLAVPDVRSPVDVDILAAIAGGVPALADREGWFVHFGRELNATDDRPHFSRDPSGMPVIEGKHLSPFAVDTAGATHHISREAAGRLLPAARTFRRARLAYREVSSSTNRTTLIAAVVPEGVVSTHTVFCVKEDLDADAQDFLCGVFNSWVANYLVRMWVATHVTAAVMARLRVPRPSRAAAEFRLIVRLSRSLAAAYATHARRTDRKTRSSRRKAQAAPDVLGVGADWASLNAAAARLYGLSRDHFVRVMETFPSLSAGERTAALRAWDANIFA